MLNKEGPSQDYLKTFFGEFLTEIYINIIIIRCTYKAECNNFDI